MIDSTDVRDRDDNRDYDIRARRALRLQNRENGVLTLGMVVVAIMTIGRTFGGSVGVGVIGTAVLFAAAYINQHQRRAVGSLLEHKRMHAEAHEDDRSMWLDQLTFLRGVRLIYIACGIAFLISTVCRLYARFGGPAWLTAAADSIVLTIAFGASIAGAYLVIIAQGRALRRMQSRYRN